MKSRKTVVKSRKVVVRAPADLIEVLDRVLDRGIVIDAWLRVSLVGLTLVDVDARVVVASIRTYVREGDSVAGQGTVARSLDAAKRPTPAPAPRRRSRAKREKVMLRCTEGCTFLRSAAGKASVRCASDPSRKCAVTAVA